MPRMCVANIISDRKTMRKRVPETNPVVIKKIAPIPIANALAVQAQFKALTDPERSTYSTVIVFHELDFVMTKDSDHPFQVDITKDVRRWMRKPSLGDTPVMITCTCADYYWTWWFHNKQHGINAWVDFPPPPPRKDGKPAGSMPGARNPKGTAGCCKHIVKLAKFLAEKRWIRG